MRGGGELVLQEFPLRNFEEARRAALMGDLLRLLIGKPSDLLSFDEVREHLKLTNFVDRGTREVPLRNIVGTLGREREFNRAFLPRMEMLRDRWRKIRSLFESQKGYPAVELYQVGDVYFVVDGHHRVSVARSLRARSIEARVREFLTPVPLRSDETMADVLLKSGLADFLEATGLKLDDPEEYRLSDPHRYARLLEHISGHKYFLSVEKNREVSWGDAIASWRDSVYRPMVKAIRDSGVLRQFPGRTEADLYLFTMDHLHYLRQRYGAASAGDAVEQVKASRGVGARIRRLFG